MPEPRPLKDVITHSIIVPIAAVAFSYMSLKY